MENNLIIYTVWIQLLVDKLPHRLHVRMYIHHLKLHSTKDAVYLLFSF